MRTLSLALLFLVPGADPAPFLPRVGCPSAARLAMPAPPQVPGAGPLTVEDAVTLAIRQNPRLSAAARDVAAARSGVRSAQALANPALTFTPAFSPGGSDEELLLQQPLEPGTRWRRRGARPQ